METNEDGWGVYIASNGMHFVPKSDWSEHELDTLCICKPSKQTIQETEVWSHHPFDKRRLQQVH